MRLAFVIIVGVLVITFSLYLAQGKPEQEFVQSISSNSLVDLDVPISQPKEIYQLMVRNTKPEITAFGLLLLILLVVALLAAKMEVVLDISHRLSDAAFDRMVKNRPASEDAVTARIMRQSGDAPRYQEALLRTLRRRLRDDEKD